ncbi:MAG: hypothetical protein K8S99_02315 [Planctomycetes bacterium]|nr:hypothetical protein [Planctomycetota bacterium]
MTTTASPTPQPRELGIPVRSINWVRLYPGKHADGRPSLWASMGQTRGGMFICDIDLATGKVRQFPCTLHNEDYPTAGFRSPTTGIVYIGGAHEGHLWAIDPSLPPAKQKLEDLGKIDPDLAIFPCRIDEAPDGALWIGAYGGCCLSRFDPKTRTFRKYGRMDETDQYFYPLCGSDGTVAGLVKMCKIHAVLIDPETGEKRTIGPTIDTDAVGGGEAAGKLLDLFKGVDGLLYIKSHAGNFRLAGMEALHVDQLPEPMPTATLPGGATVEMTDQKSAVNRTVRITQTDGSTRNLKLDWVGGGTNIFCLEQGPDGKIYGSSVLPEHLFSCDADGSNMTDHGQCSVSMGEAYSMAPLGGKLYIASYPAARFSIYDPAKPYRFGEDETANPRDIGRIDDAAFRPRAMVAGPAGRVWIGSVPDYGMWGGTLASYDPATAKFSSHRHVVHDASVVSLAYLTDLKQLLVGTSIYGGSGTTPRIKETAFVLWDPFKDAMISTETFGIEHIEGISSLLDAGGGRAYAIVTTTRPDLNPKHPLLAELVLLDVKNKRVIDRSYFDDASGWPVDVSLRRDAHGRVFGFAGLGFYSVEPGTAKRTTIWRAAGPADGIGVAGPIVGSTAYFASEHRLRAIELA